MRLDDAHKALIGTHTLKEITRILCVSEEYALVIISRLKAQGYVQARRRPRIYTISPRKIRPRHPGMYDLINKYNPVHIQVRSRSDHQVHGEYRPEDAILDAIESDSVRVVRAAFRLFNHVEDWPYLYHEAKKRGIWNKVGAMYDLARKYMRVRKKPKRYKPTGHAQIKSIKTRYAPLIKYAVRGGFPEIENKWGVMLPFNKVDMEELVEKWVR